MNDETTPDSFDSAPEQEESDKFADVTPAKDDVAPKAEPKDEPVKPAQRYIKTKINGREESIDEETLIREYQKSKAGDERLAKATQIERESKQFLEDLRNDPAKVLADPRLGLDKQKLATMWLEEQIRAELEDPAQKKLSDYEARIKAYEDRDLTEKQQRDEAEETERNTKAVNERKEHFQKTFEKALELSVLAKTPETAAAALREMALEYRLARSQGHESTPEELASAVEERQYRMMHSAAQNLSGEDLVSFLGEAVVNKIRKADLARLSNNSVGNAPSTNDSWKNEPSSKPSNKPIDPSDWRMKMRDQ